VVEALKGLTEPCKVTLYTDSQYVANAISKGWARRWQRNGWMRNKKEPALNADLWQQLLPLLEQHQTEFVWVRGHAGDELNERCDALAKAAAQQPDLRPDPGYDGQC
jgi:ribonuclease HI